MDRVVPLTVKLCPGQEQVVHICVRDFDAKWIGLRIELRLHGQAAGVEGSVTSAPLRFASGSLPPKTASWPAGWRVLAPTKPKRPAARIGNRLQPECPSRGSGCSALSASGPTSDVRTGAMPVGCELFVWLDRPITTAVATAPRQAYGSTVNSCLQAHRPERRAETTLSRDREPNRGIGH